MIEIVNIDFEVGNLDGFGDVTVSDSGNLSADSLKAIGDPIKLSGGEPTVEVYEHAADGTMTPCHPNIVSGYIMTCMSEELGGQGLIFTANEFNVGSFSLDPNGLAFEAEPLYSIETKSPAYLFRLTLQGVDGVHGLRVAWGGLPAHFVPISDEPHLWEIIGERAKTGSGCDGVYKLFVDGVLVDHREKVDNFHSWDLVTVAKYGAMCEFGLAGRNTDA